MKTTSAGTILLVGDKVLIGHVTNKPHWDIPKGGVDDGEEHIDAAIRECKEEFNLDLEKHKLETIGFLEYRKNKKDLALYFYKLDSVDLNTLYCHSFVGDKFPEIDGYTLVDVHQFHLYVSKIMDKCFTINNIYDFIKSKI